jgi:hypothetical protein
LDWDHRLVEECIQLSKAIWDDRNEFLHGKTRKEACEKLRQHVVHRVSHIYQCPSKLHRRYHKVQHIPLQERLQSSTTTLQRWLARIEHQMTMSRQLIKYESSHQLSIKQALLGVNVDIARSRKFPPWPIMFIFEMPSWDLYFLQNPYFRVMLLWC